MVRYIVLRKDLSSTFLEKKHVFESSLATEKAAAKTGFPQSVSNAKEVLLFSECRLSENLRADLPSSCRAALRYEKSNYCIFQLVTKA